MIYIHTTTISAKMIDLHSCRNSVLKKFIDPAVTVRHICFGCSAASKIRISLYVGATPFDATVFPRNAFFFETINSGFHRIFSCGCSDNSGFIPETMFEKNDLILLQSQ